jgi:hypothetical protein
VTNNQGRCDDKACRAVLTCAIKRFVPLLVAALAPR